MKKYYLHDGNEQRGPFDREELSAQQLNKDTLIWFEGIADWTRISDIDELKGIVSATPPPFVADLTAPVAAPVVTYVQPPQGMPGPSVKSGSTGRKLLIFAGVIVLLLIGIYVYNQIGYQREESYRSQEEDYRQKAINTEEDKKTGIRNNITSYVTAERNEYTYNELGGIYNLKITVKNTSDYLIDNVKVKITYFKTNGDVWDDKIIDFNMLNARSASTLRVEDTDRGVKIAYEIISIKSSALGLK